MYPSISDISKCGGEYKVARKVDSTWLNKLHIHALENI